MRLAGLAVLGSLILGMNSSIYAGENQPFQTQLSLSGIVQRIEETQQGHELLKKVYRTWDWDLSILLNEKLQWGTTSRTDTVLTRKYNPETGEEERLREITIYLRKNQPETEIVLDLVHELVHASVSPGFDPYDPSLTAGKYIWAALEGPGGEVEAVQMECSVGLEISQKLKTEVPRCEDYYSKSHKQVVREKIRKDFYRVGQAKHDVMQRLGNEEALFPLLSTEFPKLYSSTGKKAYPLALLQEFDEMTQVACQNSKNRVKKIASSAAHSQVVKFLEKRCSDTSESHP
jgi:hypothetical protein